MSLISFKPFRIVPKLALVAAAAMMLNTQSFANNGPELTLEGANAGTPRIDNPVVFRGTARDPQRIGNISGNVQSVRTQLFVLPDGNTQQRGAPIAFNFSKKSEATRWESPAFNLPPGEYVFRMQATDLTGAVSPVMTMPFIATGNTSTTNRATRQATTTRATASAAPAIAIQFPQNGAVVSEAMAFSGIAKDDRAVVGVLATIMNTKTGQYLQPTGKFGRQTQLQLKTVKGKNAQWSTPQIQLPAGEYLLSVKAVDDQGQEGQWAQSKFKVETAPTVTPAATAAAPATSATGMAANGMSYCAGGSDADGDGFGWENNKSCVVAGSKADKHPTCASSASDPDGDGYGWENEKSCIVVVHCASAASDPDGDGFGWENNKSCIVLDTATASKHPRCAQGAASDPDGDGYGWENNATCLVK